MSERPKVLYIMDRREPLWLSTARDTVSFGMLLGTAVAANTLMPPSAWINAAIGISWMLWLLGKGEIRKQQMDANQARTWLDENYPSEGGEA
jgi:hypothetical protein